MRSSNLPLRLITAASLLLISLYIFVKRVADPYAVLAFSDWLSMHTASQQECSLIPSGAWTPPVTCLNAFLGGFVFPNPLAYLVATLILKFSMILALYKIYKHIEPSIHCDKRQSIVAIYSVLFISIGGAGLFLIGGTDLILLSSIYSGMWAHLVVLVSLVFFFSRRYFLSSLFIALGVFLHPANTFNVFMILLIVVSIMCLTQSNKHKIQLTLFVITGLVALSLQYLATYGIPYLGILHPTMDVFNSAANPQYSTNDWYNYILGQDPDDLSLIWLLSSKIGKSYLVFFVFGLYIAIQVEETYKPSQLIKRPAIFIVLASAFYFLTCVLIEHFRSPQFIFEKMLIVQPRRALFLPTILLSYYIVRYTLDYFWLDTQSSLRRLLTLLVFYSWFFGIRIFSVDYPTINKYVAISFYCLVLISILALFSSKRTQSTLSLQSISKNLYLWGTLSVVAIVLKTLPFSTPLAVANTKAMFFDTKQRSMIDYLRVSSNLRHSDFIYNYLDLVDWIKENTTVNQSFVSAGFSENEIMDLPKFTERKIITLNIYRYRGGMHFDKKNFLHRISYFENLLGVPINELTATSGTIDNLENIVRGFDTQHFQNMRLPGANGKPFNYFVTTYNLTLKFPLVFQTGNISVYKITPSNSMTD